jgi:hypothetical protein
MRSLPIAVATVLFFSFQVVALSQSRDLSPRKFYESIQEFGKQLAKPNDQDDPIKKLQREQLAEARAGVEFAIQKIDAGTSSFADLSKYAQYAFAAAFNLAETNEEKIYALEHLVEAAKFSERVAKETAYISADGSEYHRTAKFRRLDAEINLLKFKKDPATFQFSFRVGQ